MFEDMRHNEESEKEPYQSQDGFIITDVKRGFTEIERIFWIIKNITDGRSFICGGYVRYMCSSRRHPVPATDVDVYSIYENDFHGLKKNFMESEGLVVKHENDMAITFDIPEKNSILFYSPIVQLIKPLEKGRVMTTGTREKILDSFDFTIIRGSLLNEKEAIVDADFLHDEEIGLLRLKNIHCPISSALRCMKYSRKGYFLRPFQAYKLFADWDQRDDAYRDKIAELIDKSEAGHMTQEEIDDLEALMRID